MFLEERTYDVTGLDPSLTKRKLLANFAIKLMLNITPKSPKRQVRMLPDRVLAAAFEYSLPTEVMDLEVEGTGLWGRDTGAFCGLGSCSVNTASLFMRCILWEKINVHIHWLTRCYFCFLGSYGEDVFEMPMFFRSRCLSFKLSRFCYCLRGTQESIGGI